jgi:NAD(P)-dependent dehydrogenase (short-subunit alcohol dehydrogenase family)
MPPESDQTSPRSLNGGVIGPHYAASKAALGGLMRNLATPLAGAGVTVNSIAPALIGGTRMLPSDPAGPGALPPDRSRGLRIAARRRSGSARPSREAA